MAYLNSFVPGISRFVAIRLAETRELVGTATMYWHDDQKAVDVGILVGRPGNGYGKEAFAAIVSSLLEEGAPKVTAGTASGNAPMLALMRAAGMREVRDVDEASELRYFEVLAGV
jgi:RimJ/RimL family protein N-acetyltransferase